MEFYQYITTCLWADFWLLVWTSSFTIPGLITSLRDKKNSCWAILTVPVVISLVLVWLYRILVTEVAFLVILGLFTWGACVTIVDEWEIKETQRLRMLGKLY